MSYKVHYFLLIPFLAKLRSDEKRMLQDKDFRICINCILNHMCLNYYFKMIISVYSFSFNIDQNGLHVPFNFNKLQTCIFLIISSDTPFLRTFALENLTIVQLFLRPLEMFDKGQLRKVFLKGIGATPRKCSHQEIKHSSLLISVEGQEPNFNKHQLVNIYA